MAQPHMQLIIENMAMHVPGSKTPSPLVAMSLENAESGLISNFTATLHVQGNHFNRTHVGSFEMMLYEFAQMQGSSSLGAFLEFGWEDGPKLEVDGFFIEFQASVKGDYMEYLLKGTGNLSNAGNIKGIALPAVNGNYRPSAVLEASLDYVKANEAFEYDIDHDDEVVPIQRPASVTSLAELIYGHKDATGQFHQGLLQQSYCEGSRSSAFGIPGNIPSEMLRQAGYDNPAIAFAMKEPVSTTQRSASAYSFSITEPTFYQKGVIRYKNNVNISNYVNAESLVYGGLYTNILSITATYNGVTQQIVGAGKSVQTGLALGLDGKLMVSKNNRQNSYSASAPSLYGAGNAINNLNAVTTQFNTDIRVTVIGSPNIYRVGEGIKVIVKSEGTLNPITGLYRILKVQHNITGTSYTTTLTLKRLDLITANDVSASVSGYTSGVTIDGKRYASHRTSDALNFGVPFQNIMNLMRRGEL